jgi:hypothetical protein
MIWEQGCPPKRRGSLNEGVRKPATGSEVAQDILMGKLAGIDLRWSSHRDRKITRSNGFCGCAFFRLTLSLNSLSKYGEGTSGQRFSPSPRGERGPWG